MLFQIFSKYPNLIAAISSKKDGTMKLSKYDAGDKIIVKNRRKFLKQFGTKNKSVICAWLVHGDNIEIVGRKQAGKIIKECDGLLTKEKNIFLSITVADCLPVFLYDPEKNAVGILHCGWKNLAQNILEGGIKKMKNNFRTNPENILAGIGPGVSLCRFEIGEEIFSHFKNFSPKTIKKHGKTFLDLKDLAEKQLLRVGLKKGNINISPECTCCFKDKYFSYRREGKKNFGAMMAIIGLKPVLTKNPRS